jgi:hypothetical protein
MPDTTVFIVSLLSGGFSEHSTGVEAHNLQVLRCSVLCDLLDEQGGRILREAV